MSTFPFSRLAMIVPHGRTATNLYGAGPQLLHKLIVPLLPGQVSPVAGVIPGEDGHSAAVKCKDGRTFLVSASDTSGIAVTETLANGNVVRSATSNAN